MLTMIFYWYLIVQISPLDYKNNYYDDAIFTATMTNPTHHICLLKQIIRIIAYPCPFVGRFFRWSQCICFNSECVPMFRDLSIRELIACKSHICFHVFHEICFLAQINFASLSASYTQNAPDTKQIIIWSHCKNKHYITYVFSPIARLNWIQRIEWKHLCCAPATGNKLTATAIHLCVSQIRYVALAVKNICPIGKRWRQFTIKLCIWQSYKVKTM